jgi:hypothetical protein
MFQSFLRTKFVPAGGGRDNFPLPSEGGIGSKNRTLTLFFPYRSLALSLATGSLTIRLQHIHASKKTANL